MKVYCTHCGSDATLASQVWVCGNKSFRPTPPAQPSSELPPEAAAATAAARAAVARATAAQAAGAASSGPPPAPKYCAKCGTKALPAQLFCTCGHRSFLPQPPGKRAWLVGGAVFCAAVLALILWRISKEPPKPEPTESPIVVKSPAEEPLSAADMLHGEANGQMRRKEFAAAAATYTRILQLRPDDALALLGRGNAHLSQSQFDKARADYGAVLEKQPKNAEAAFARGTLHWLLGDGQAAEADYRTAVAEAPDEQLFANRLSAVLDELGRERDAEELFRTAYQDGHQRTWALSRWMEYLIARKRFDDVISHAHTLEGSAPAHIVGYYAGRAYLERKDFRSAAETLERAVRADPDEVQIEAFYLLAFASRENGNAQACASALEEYAKRVGQKFDRRLVPAARMSS